MTKAPTVGGSAPDDPIPSGPVPGGPIPGGPDLSTVADELYGLVPAQFTAVRDARAAAARRAGDRQLAAEIKGLKKPTTGAWLANLLVRERRDEIGHLLELGDELRRAQAGLAVDELRRLSQERHKVVANLRHEARELARDLSQPVSEAAALELETTLEAALADDAAAGALRSGRLTTGLRYSGLGLSDLVSAAQAPPGEPPTVPQSASAPVPAQPGAKRHEAGSRAPDDAPRAEAEKALRRAETTAEDAERDAKEHRHRVDALRAEVDRAHHQVIGLERQLRELRALEDAASQELRQAEKARDGSYDKLQAAHDQLSRARAALELVEPPAT
ncbi:MAG TPA: hypothetical protein VEJ84_10010 [Acidimicrobiales bacterium]|nr:hypothetical protein [Acidimicrobiales bacterium]